MRLAVVTGLAWAVTCAGAHASTVSVKPADPYGPARLDLFAAAGERNDVQVDPGTQPQTIRVRDAAGLTPGASCVAEDAQTAVCPAAAFLHIELGDGDDRLGGTLREVANVAGGDGDDELRWPFALIEGGRGADTITGNVVDGGPGNDVLEARTLRYSDRAEPVTVDLVAGDAGGPGEQDRVLPGVTKVMTGFGADVVRAADGALTVETAAGDDAVTMGAGGGTVDAGTGNDTVTGGAGVDRVYGSDGDDSLDGGAGDDELHGDGGADTITGGAGTDRFHGGDGTDRIDARDGQRERVDCNEEFFGGALTRDVAGLDARDTHRLCELVERSGPPRLEPIAVLSESGQRRVIVTCPPRAQARVCAGTVRIRGDRARPFAVKPGRRAQLAVRPRRRAYVYSVTIALRSGPTFRVSLVTVQRP